MEANMILTCAVILALALTADGLSCHECKSSNPADACFSNPDSVRLTSCLDIVQQCVVRRTVTLGTAGGVTMERDCEIKKPLVDKTECTSSGNQAECTVYCKYDNCNNVLADAVEDCTRTDCRKGSAAMSVPTPLLLLAAALMKMLF